MLKIISANVNGIRSAYKKGFYEYIATSGADIVCVQELKAQEADLSDEMKNPHRDARPLSGARLLYTATPL